MRTLKASEAVRKFREAFPQTKKAVEAAAGVNEIRRGRRKQRRKHVRQNICIQGLGEVAAINCLYPTKDGKILVVVRVRREGVDYPFTKTINPRAHSSLQAAVNHATKVRDEFKRNVDKLVAERKALRAARAAARM